MLEIIAIYNFAKNIGEIVELKGRRRLGYQLLAVAMWIGGEVAGAIIGTILLGPGGGECAIYIFAIVGAALSAGTVYLLVKNLDPVAKPPSFDDAMP